MTVWAPEPLADHHDIGAFNCGERSLDDWLRRRALANQVSGASRTFVACEGHRVFAYYALASGGIAVSAAPGRSRRNMPDPIPIVILGRLAVDRSYAGQGMGRALVHDAGKRVAYAAQAIGIRGLVVRGLSSEASAFYQAVGFDPSPLDPMTLMVTLADLKASL